MDRRGSKKALRALAERLHDGPLQSMAALRFRMSDLENKGGAYPEELAQLGETVGEVQNELSKLVQLLTDPEADEEQPELAMNLARQLERLCREFEQSTGIACQLLVIPDHARLPSLESVIVLRAIRELLANILKHARAKNVEVTSMIRDDDCIVFTVKDDGIGLVDTLIDFEESGLEREGSFGLWSVRERLKEVGGHLEFRNQDGFCVNIVLPRNANGDSDSQRTARAG